MSNIFFQITFVYNKYYIVWPLNKNSMIYIVKIIICIILYILIKELKFHRLDIVKILGSILILKLDF